MSPKPSACSGHLVLDNQPGDLEREKLMTRGPNEGSRLYLPGFHKYDEREFKGSAQPVCEAAQRVSCRESVTCREERGDTVEQLSQEEGRCEKRQAPEQSRVGETRGMSSEMARMEPEGLLGKRT